MTFARSANKKNYHLTGAGVGLVQWIVSEPENSLAWAAALLQQARAAS